MSELGATKYDTRRLHPFGLEVTAARHGEPLEAIGVEQAHAWIAEHRVIVLRDFAPLEGPRMARYCASLGEPLKWSFGLVNELHIKEDTENYLYTDSDVPLHWDGAFVGRIPHYIFFHCIEAPPAGSGGETLFCDTSLVLERAGADVWRRWGPVVVEYTTDKIVHYGGSFTSPLLAIHPVSGEPTIRYAEPVEGDLNPVWLRMPGMSSEASAELVAAMHERLHAPEVCLAHAWRDGDVVIADNHALLHGRRAFHGSATRHLRRINIMDPPQRGARLDWIIDNLLIRRVEYLAAEIPIVALPLLVSLRDSAFLGTATFWEGVVVFILLFNFGDMINCYADRDLDKVYKPHLSRAVHRLGVDNVRWQIGVTAVLACLVTAHLSWRNDNWMLLGLVVVGLALGAAYSVEPVRLKGRGLLQLLCLWSIIFVGPMMFTSALISGFPPPPVVLALAAGFATIQMGVILFNTAEDYPEDKEAGVKTTIVSLGLVRGVTLGMWLAVIGGACTFTMMLLGYRARAVPPAYGFAALAFLGMVITMVVIAMNVVVRATRGKSIKDAALVVKAAGPMVPVWVTAVAWSSFAAALVLFVWGS